MTATMDVRTDDTEVHRLTEAAESKLHGSEPDRPSSPEPTRVVERDRNRSLHHARGFADFSVMLHSTTTLADTCALICRAAVVVIAGAEYAAITRPPGVATRNAASTDSTAGSAEQIQLTVHQGPSVDAVSGEDLLYSPDVTVDPRWPLLHDRAVSERAGVRSAASFRLFMPGDTLGSLTLYASGVDAFTASAIDLATVFAVHASVAMRAAIERESMANLSIALQSSRRIGAAIGILMAGGLSEEAAFAELRRSSQNANRKLRDVADDVLLTGALPDLPAIAKRSAHRGTAVPAARPAMDPYRGPSMARRQGVHVPCG